MKNYSEKVGGSKVKNLYQILEVKESATYDEIKKAYRRLAKKYHPDITKNDETSSVLFNEIGKAYEILSDEKKRRRYDEERTRIRKSKISETKTQSATKQNRATNQKKSEDFSDLFGQYFGFQETTDKNVEGTNKVFHTEELFHSFFNPRKKS